ncbi:MAG TPA: hypothetical protein VEJ36_07770 [Nitrososphaerales archaeon]|nr:hypothetical protein [Nitrososphaerales archaeon]
MVDRRLGQKRRMGSSERIHYKRNDKLLVISVVMVVLALAAYYSYFDILSPGIPGSGSVRALTGAYFVALVLLLAAVQLLYVAGVLHLVMRSFYFERRDFLKAFYVSATMVFMFSVYYVLFPSWGPYYFITGPLLHIPSTDYLVLGSWTAVIVAFTTVNVRKAFGFKKGEVRWSMLILLSGALFLLALAFAEG